MRWEYRFRQSRNTGHSVEQGAFSDSSTPQDSDSDTISLREAAEFFGLGHVYVEQFALGAAFLQDIEHFLRNGSKQFLDSIDLSVEDCTRWR
jgi:hypothetical protein